jgi:hypothetical protein
MRESEHFHPEKEIIVTLKLILNSLTIFFGHLVEISRDGLVFDYIVLKQSLESHIDAGCEVSLKKNMEAETLLERLSCKIVHDELIPARSPFGIPLRRCGIRFSKPLPLSRIQSLIKLK